MALTAFIPEVWNAVILTELQKRAVYASLANGDYEGEISAYGDTVHVNTLTPATVRAYDRTSGTPVTVDAMSTTGETLTIDQANYFAFRSKDIDAAQVRDNGQLIEKQTASSVQKLSIASDTFLAGKLVAAVPSGNDLGAVTVSTPNDVYEMLVELGIQLDDADVPEDGRAVVLPPVIAAQLALDTRFVGTGSAASDQVARNGIIGSAAGFTIAKSTNVPKASAAFEVVAGLITRALSYAEQIVSTESIRDGGDFADIVRGLHVFGGEVFEAEVLAGATVTVS